MTMKLPHMIPAGRPAFLRGAFAIMLSAYSLAAPLPASADSFGREERLSPLVAGYLERARIMIDDRNFAGVIDQLKHIETQGNHLSDKEREDFSYMLARALFERGESECVEMLREFAYRYPASHAAMAARLAAADYFFFAHHFGNALAAYEEIDFSRITPADRPLYEYRMALSMVKCGRYDEAEPIFAKLHDDRRFNLAADYYLAYIDYIRGDLQKAYEGFGDVAQRMDDDNPEGLAPAYYMAHIEYAQGKYADVVAHGRSLMQKKPVGELMPDTQRIVGLSYFKLGEHEAARSFLSNYVDTPGITPAFDAVYVLGVLDYNDGDLEEAAAHFASLTDLDNDLAQSAYLYLGQIAVKEGDDNAAAISFEKASKMNYDKGVTETALFNYLAARTRGGNIPFSSSIPLLNGFLNRFPGSRYTPKVEEYLATAYFNEKDYARALESIRKIPSPSREVMEAKQKILYELGMECMAANRPREAREYLSEAVRIKGDERLAAQASLWLGDACYALGDYAAAEDAYQDYLAEDRRGENRPLALYNLAYSQMMQEKWGRAAEGFSDALKASPLLPKRLHDDALIRLADVQYYDGDYRSALRNYNAAIDGGAADSDYAAYRRAVMHGLGGDIKGKLAELSSFPTDYPSSAWIPNALLEKGQTYAGLGDTGNAVKAFEQLRSSYRQTAQARKGMLSLAITYMQSKQTDKAEEAYREVISKWPSSEEAALANDDLRRFHAANGGLKEYAAFLNSVSGAPKIDANEMESLAFEGAETAFADNVGNTSLLERYVADYPDGRFLSQALLDIATGMDERGDSNGALAAIDRLLDRRGDSPQVPEALLLKAEILENEGPARREETLQTYRLLEERGGTEYLPDAYAGIMRNTGKDSERLKYAALVKQSGGLSAAQIEEAEFFEASAMLHNGDSAKGEEILRRLAANPKSISGAKAAVMLGQHYFDSGDMTAAEKTLTAFTDEGSPHEYWLARGFIALADVYHAKKKDYLAVEYLKSLRDNYPGDELDIHDMITTRLAEWK